MANEGAPQAPPELDTEVRKAARKLQAVLIYAIQQGLKSGTVPEKVVAMEPVLQEAIRTALKLQDEQTLSREMERLKRLIDDNFPGAEEIYDKHEAEMDAQRQAEVEAARAAAQAPQPPTTPDTEPAEVPQPKGPTAPMDQRVRISQEEFEARQSLERSGIHHDLSDQPTSAPEAPTQPPEAPPPAPGPKPGRKTMKVPRGTARTIRRNGEREERELDAQLMSDMASEGGRVIDEPEQEVSTKPAPETPQDIFGDNVPSDVQKMFDKLVSPKKKQDYLAHLQEEQLQQEERRAARSARGAKKEKGSHGKKDKRLKPDRGMQRDMKRLGEDEATKPKETATAQAPAQPATPEPVPAAAGPEETPAQPITAEGTSAQPAGVAERQEQLYQDFTKLQRERETQQTDVAKRQEQLYKRYTKLQREQELERELKRQEDIKTVSVQMRKDVEKAFSEAQIPRPSERENLYTRYTELQSAGKPEPMPPPGVARPEEVEKIMRGFLKSGAKWREESGKIIVTEQKELPGGAGKQSTERDPTAEEMIEINGKRAQGVEDVEAEIVSPPPPSKGPAPEPVMAGPTPAPEAPGAPEGTGPEATRSGPGVTPGPAPAAAGPEGAAQPAGTAKAEGTQKELKASLWEAIKKLNRAAKEKFNWYKSSKEELVRRSAELDTQLEKLGRVEKGFRWIGEKYNKLDWKGKLAVGAALGVGMGVTWAAGSPLALAFFLAGSVVQRTAGLATMFLKFEGGKHEETAATLFGKKFSSKEVAMAKAIGYTAAMGAAMAGLAYGAKQAAETEFVKDNYQRVLNWLQHFREPQTALTPEQLANQQKILDNLAAQRAIPDDTVVATEKLPLAQVPPGAPPEVTPIEATPGKGSEWMMKRLVEQLKTQGVTAEQYPGGSVMHKLLSADGKSLDNLIHRVAGDEGLFKKDTGENLLIKLGDKLSVRGDGSLSFMNARGEEFTASTRGAFTAPFTPGAPPVPAPGSTEELGLTMERPPVQNLDFVSDEKSAPLQGGPTVPLGEHGFPQSPLPPGAEQHPAPVQEIKIPPSQPAENVWQTQGGQQLTTESGAPVTASEVATNSLGLSVPLKEVHIYADPEAGKAFVFGDTPQKQLELVLAYLKEKGGTVYGTDISGKYRIPYSLTEKGILDIGAPVRTPGFFGFGSTFMEAPRPDEFKTLIK